jgi:hypothetical protein
MARAYERAGSELTAQASAAITAGAFSAGTETPIEIESTGNADGAQWLDCYINVTSAPATAGSCELWMAASPDGTNYAAYEYALTVAVPTATGRYHLGQLIGLPREMKLKVKAIDFGFTAGLTVVPRWIADA